MLRATQREHGAITMEKKPPGRKVRFGASALEATPSLNQKGTSVSETRTTIKKYRCYALRATAWAQYGESLRLLLNLRYGVTFRAEGFTHKGLGRDRAG